MQNWDLNESFDKMGSAYFQSYDEINNIALDISGIVILRNDIILYNGLSLNNTLTQLQTQYNNISISGVLNSIVYLKSVDTYFHRWQGMYVTTVKKRSTDAHFNTNNHMVNAKA